MGAVDDLISAHAGQAAPGGTSAVDALIAKHQGQPQAAGGSAVDSLIDKWKGFDSPQGRAALGAKAAGVFDAQRAAVARHFTGQTDPTKQREAYREKAGLSDIYNDVGKFGPLGHAAQGMLDFGTDTLTDPVTYESLAAAPVARGLIRGAKALEPLANKVAPEAMKFGKSAAEMFAQFVAPGGKDVGALEQAQGRGARDTVLGASGKRAAEAEELGSRLNASFDAATKDLTEDEKFNVYQALKRGDRPRRALLDPTTAGSYGGGLTPKETEAFGKLRATSRQAAYLNAGAPLRHEIDIREGGLEKAPEADLFRYQKTAGNPEVSSLRGGTFFATKPNLADLYKTEKPHPLGGANLVKRAASGKNVLHVDADEGELSYAALDKLGIHLEDLGSANLEKTLKGLGVPDAEAEKLAAGDYFSALDRAASEAAKRHGYDAIKSNKEFFALDPAAHAPARGKTLPLRPAVEPFGGFGEPKNDDEMSREFQRAFPVEPAKAMLGPKRSWSRVPVKPMELPPELQEFKNAVGERQRETFKPRYLAAPHTAEEGAEHVPARTSNLLRFQDPHLKPQTPFDLDKDSLPKFDAAWRNMFESAAKDRSKTALEDEFAKAGLDPNDPAVSAALTRQIAGKGDARTNAERVKDGLKAVSRFGRAAQVGLTPTHIGNVVGLQAVHAPETIPEAVGTWLKAMRDPSRRYDLFREGREMGAVGGGREAKPFFQEGPLSHIPGLGAWSRKITDLTFTYDKAAKQAMARAYAAKGIGGGGYGAGRQATEDLIDYENRSDLARMMEYGSKFPTYYSQLPGSVLRGLAKHPLRNALLNRASGGLLLGGTANTPVGPAQSGASSAKIGRDLGRPQDYVRSSISEIPRAVLSLIAAGVGRNPDQKNALRYMTYGKDPLSHKGMIPTGLASIGAQALPFGPAALEDLGWGKFRQRPGGELMRALLYTLTTLEPK